MISVEDADLDQDWVKRLDFWRNNPLAINGNNKKIIRQGLSNHRLGGDAFFRVPNELQ
jgi:hypothetical protein